MITTTSFIAVTDSQIQKTRKHAVSRMRELHGSWQPAIGDIRSLVHNSSLNGKFGVFLSRYSHCLQRQCTFATYALYTSTYKYANNNKLY